MSITRTKAADLGSTAADAAQSVAQNAAQSAAVVAQNAADAAQSVAHSAAQNAAVVAQNARQSAGSAAQTTAAGVKAGVKQGVFSARRWAAPRLEDAADYTTTTVAPAVSSALLATAKKVKPADPRRKTLSALKWSLLASACLAAAGAVAAAVRYKYRTAMAADAEAEPIAPTATATTPAPDEAAEPARDDVEASVNGKVSRDGW